MLELITFNNKMSVLGRLNQFYSCWEFSFWCAECRWCLHFSKYCKFESCHSERNVGRLARPNNIIKFVGSFWWYSKCSTNLQHNNVNYRSNRYILETEDGENDLLIYCWNFWFLAECLRRLHFFYAKKDAVFESRQMMKIICSLMVKCNLDVVNFVCIFTS